MEIENSNSGRWMIRSGTGLANIRAIRAAAEKYQGAVKIQMERNLCKAFL